MRILITGASGCIGHYICQELISSTNHELYLLVRNPKKLQVNTQFRPGITVLQGDMKEIEQLTDLLKTIDTAVLTATSWGGKDIFEINVNKTHQLLNLLDSNRCQQVIYFSTASVLDRHNRLLKEAGEIGTDYIRSKYECISKLSDAITSLGNANAPQITTLFPTLVLGGDRQKPYSHLSAGLSDVPKWTNLIRFFQADGSFHFIHGRDIAQVVKYLIDNPPTTNQPRQFVLGQKCLTVNQAIAEICTYLNKKIYFRIPLSLTLANIFIVLFRIQMAAWDRYCLQYRHFTYEKVINPDTFGLPNYCPTLTDVLKNSGIPPGTKDKA